MTDFEQGQPPQEDADVKTVGQLGTIVQQEAHRVLTEEQLEPNPELVAAGWERRFITDASRIKEVTDLYTELGFEIHIEPLNAAEFQDECEDCSLVALLKFVTVYTRKKRL